MENKNDIIKMSKKLRFNRFFKNSYDNSIIIKLYLNIKKNIFIIYNRIKSNFIDFFNKKEIKELNNPIKYILGYGVIIWPVLFTFFNFKFHLLYIIGSGALVYMVYDFLDYLKNIIIDIIRGKR